MLIGWITAATISISGIPRELLAFTVGRTRASSGSHRYVCVCACVRLAIVFISSHATIKLNSASGGRVHLYFSLNSGYINKKLLPYKSLGQVRLC